MIYRVDEQWEPTFLRGTRWADCAYDYLSQYVDGLIHEENTEFIDFWGRFTIRITTDRYSRLYLVAPNGTQIPLGTEQDMNPNRAWRFTLIKSDNFMFFSMNRDYGGNITLIWMVDEDNRDYFGGGGYNHTFNTTELYNSAVVAYDVLDTTSPFYFTKPLPFVPPQNKVGFLDNYFITNNISKSVAIKDLYSCTSVVYRSTLTVLGHNFLAVDTNTLINSDDTAQAQ